MKPALKKLLGVSPQVWMDALASWTLTTMYQCAVQKHATFDTQANKLWLCKLLQRLGHKKQSSVATYSILNKKHLKRNEIILSS